MTEPIRILTWWWDQPGGRTLYTKDHLLTWRDMLRRNLTIPHTIACVTDLVDDLEGIEIIRPPQDFADVRIPTWGPEKPQCLRRIAMFAPDAERTFGKRFVCMDMDSVIAGNLDDLFTRSEDIVLYASPKGRTYNPRPYNGSMLMMTAGARPEVYTRFTPEGAKEAGELYVGSDQAWISHVLGPDEAVWNEGDGVAWWRRPQPGQRLMFFPGSPKPWEVAEAGTDAWVARHYHRSSRGRALILGYAQTIWDDVQEAMKTGPFDAVIASPEAAAHWPRKVDHIARDDDHALRLARMHGYEDFIFCGAQERIAA